MRFKLFLFFLTCLCLFQTSAVLGQTLPNGLCILAKPDSDSLGLYISHGVIVGQKLITVGHTAVKGITSVYCINEGELQEVTHAVGLKPTIHQVYENPRSLHKGLSTSRMSNSDLRKANEPALAPYDIAFYDIAESLPSDFTIDESPVPLPLSVEASVFTSQVMLDWSLGKNILAKAKKIKVTGNTTKLNSLSFPVAFELDPNDATRFSINVDDIATAHKWANLFMNDTLESTEGQSGRPFFTRTNDGKLALQGLHEGSFKIPGRAGTGGLIIPIQTLSQIVKINSGPRGCGPLLEQNSQNSKFNR